MIQTVVKRDGRIVGFNARKIGDAVRKAMVHTEAGENEELIHLICEHVANRGKVQMTVEEIQDAVEVELMKSRRKDVAQKYIAYRNQRSIARKAKTRDMFLEIINIKSNDVTPRECQHECRHAGWHDDEVCQRDHQTFRRRLPVERRGERGGQAQLSAHS